MEAESGRARRKKKAGSKDLRTGFSTGTASAAAAKAALTRILFDETPDRVAVDLPIGRRLTIKINRSGRISQRAAWAEVIKDGGDDPDVTHKALIRVEVFLEEGKGQGPSVVFKGGQGVGRVTRPGLPVKVGEPAINPVPRKMIRESLDQVRKKAGIGPELRAEVVISVDQGEKLARRTLNPRLGILGGISILGTHGLVKPFSHKAYTATIDSALSIVRAAGIREAVLTTGGKSEKRAMLMRPDLDKVSFIQIADFFAYALRRCAKEGMTRITLVSFFGKAVKQAMGLEYTHAHKKAMDFAQLGGWFQQAGAGAELVKKVEEANTARQVLEILKEQKKQNLVSEVGRRMLAQIREFAGPAPEVKAVIIDFEQGILFQERLEAGE